MIYIQSNEERSLPHHFDCACALYGAIDSARNYRLTTFEEIESGKFDNLIRTNLFVGSVEFMRAVFKRIGLNDVRLPINSNREHEVITLLEAQNRVTRGEKLFIKPIEIKLFTGFVLDGFIYPCLSNIPKDTKVMAYEPFNTVIETEWRCYVLNGSIIDSRNYSGDFMQMPDYGYVKKEIEKNKILFPCAYTIDIAVLSSGNEVVIEFNDAWAIGNYGMPNDLYIKFLDRRYFEIVASNMIY